MAVIQRFKLTSPHPRWGNRGRWRQLCASRELYTLQHPTTCFCNSKYNSTGCESLFCLFLLYFWFSSSHEWNAQPFKHYVNSKIRDSSLVRTATCNMCCSSTALLCKLICFLHLGSPHVKWRTSSFLLLMLCALFSDVQVYLTFKSLVWAGISPISQTTLQTPASCYVRHKHSKQDLLCAL